jgi:D-xylose transport system permease protein
MAVSLTLKKRFRQNLQTYTMLLAMVGIWILFTVLTNGFYLSPQNFSNLFRQMTVTSFLATGMVLVIITGNIDLSVGKLAGFVSVVVAYFQAYIWNKLLGDQPLVAAALSVVVGLLVGTLFGMLQGYIISYRGVPSFIVTLGGMFVLRGGILIITEGKTMPANQPVFDQIAQGYLSAGIGWLVGLLVVALLFMNVLRSRTRKAQYGFEVPSLALDMLGTLFFCILVIIYIVMVNLYNGIQVPVLLLAVTALLMSYVANNTPFGRYAYAIGGNRDAARLSGINIKWNIFLIFMLMGFLCGVAGIVLASYVGYGTVAAGEGYELDAIAACILGGTSTLGGEGTIFGAMLGSLIMASLTNGLQMLNVPPSYQYLVKGAVLILAVYADVYFKKKR